MLLYPPNRSENGNHCLKYWFYQGRLIECTPKHTSEHTSGYFIAGSTTVPVSYETSKEIFFMCNSKIEIYYIKTY